MTADYIGWPDLQPRIAAAVEGGSGADIIEMWDIWPYLYSENMVPVDDLARAVGEEYGGFYDWVVDTASVDGKWYSVPHGNSSSAFAYRISLVEEAGIEDPKNNFPKTYEELFALGKTLKEMGKPFGRRSATAGGPARFAYPFMWAHGAMEVEEDGTTVAINKPESYSAPSNVCDRDRADRIADARLRRRSDGLAPRPRRDLLDRPGPKRPPPRGRWKSRSDVIPQRHDRVHARPKEVLAAAGDGGDGDVRRAGRADKGSAVAPFIYTLF